MRQLAVFPILMLALATAAPARGAGGVGPPAAAAGGVGEVAFANSGAPAAQAPFRRGLALLHNFEYGDAAAEFQRAQRIDPGFAMAYWGEAMTYNHPLWAQQDAAAARAALSRLAATPEARLAKAKTERERAYLGAVEALYGEGTKEERDLRYADAMAAVHQRYPDDVDGTAFYALSLLGTAHHGRDFAVYMRAAALLEEVFPTHRGHPGVLHYLIHCYDDPIHAPLGVRAARLYGAVAPDAGHALHMTSHIFIALGDWDGVIAANERAMAVVDRHLAAHGEHGRTCGHYASWLDYAYLQEHRLADAERALAACRRSVEGELAKPAPSVEVALAPDSAAGAVAEMRLVHSIETGRWEADASDAAPDASYVGPRFALAYGEALAAAGGDLPAFRAAAARLRERQKELLAALDKNRGAYSAPRERAEVAGEQVEALLLLREGKAEEGIARLKKAAAAEGAMPFEFGPPAIEKPTYELLGDELAALGRPAEAEAAYRAALSRAPGRTRSLEGLLKAQQAQSETAAARETKAQLDRYVRAAPAR